MKIRHRKLDERTEREEDEEKDTDCFQPTSHCPACNRQYDVALILPCSHTMCRHCVAAGERTDSGRCVVRSAGLSVCSVLCPRCRLPVELPCWTWSAAVSCLPEHPTLSPAHVSTEAEIKMRQREGYLQVRNSWERNLKMVVITKAGMYSKMKGGADRSGLYITSLIQAEVKVR